MGALRRQPSALPPLVNDEPASPPRGDAHPAYRRSQITHRIKLEAALAVRSVDRADRKQDFAPLDLVRRVDGVRVDDGDEHVEVAKHEGHFGTKAGVDDVVLHFHDFGSAEADIAAADV